MANPIQPTVIGGADAGIATLNQLVIATRLVAANVAISTTGAAGTLFQGNGAGVAGSYTTTPTLGASGTPGSLTFGNATSGTVTLKPVTGALGTVTLLLPDANDTLAGIAATQTLTNKTINTDLNSITGTTTNDNAVAGTIGEFVSSTVLVGSAVGITSNTATDITTISLTAGDWDVWGAVAFSVATGTIPTTLAGWINTISATFPTLPNGGGEINFRATFATGAYQAQFPVGQMRISIATTTTVYLSTVTIFTVSTMSGYGFLGARRVR